MKSEAMDTVRTAIHRVLKGEIFVSERMVNRMLDKMVNAHAGDAIAAGNALRPRV